MLYVCPWQQCFFGLQRKNIFIYSCSTFEYTPHFGRLFTTRYYFLSQYLRNSENVLKKLGHYRTMWMLLVSMNKYIYAYNRKNNGQQVIPPQFCMFFFLLKQKLPLYFFVRSYPIKHSLAKEMEVSCSHNTRTFRALILPHPRFAPFGVVRAIFSFLFTLLREIIVGIAQSIFKDC